MEQLEKELIQCYQPITELEKVALHNTFLALPLTDCDDCPYRNKCTVDCNLINIQYDSEIFKLENAERECNPEDPEL